MRQIYRIIKGILFICLLCLFISLLYSQESYPRLKNYNVIFQKNYLDDNSIMAVNNTINDFFLNIEDSLHDINTSLLEDLIMSHKYVQKADVYLSIDDTINIFIDFRTPYVRSLENNEVFYYDREGIKLPKMKFIKDGLLLISGEFKRQDFQLVLNFIERIYQNELLSKLVGGVYYDQKYGYLLSSRLCDLGIVLGNNSFVKINDLNIIENFSILLSEELGCDYCKLIDLSFNDQIICVK